MTPDKPSCGNCTAGNFKDDNDIGECRHRPPTAMLQPQVNKLTGNLTSWGAVSVWPPVRRGDWCRKHCAAGLAGVIQWIPNMSSRMPLPAEDTTK